MKEFFINNKNKILKIMLALLVLVLISLFIFLLLYLFNVVYFDNGIKFNISLFNSFKNTWYGCIFYVLFQAAMTTLLCAIPGTSMSFIVLSTAIYEVHWQAFVLAFAGVILSSLIMYIVGRIGGYKICAKIIGEEDCEKAMMLVRNKGTVFFPLMMLFPVFPDDALVLIAGTSKMSLKWFIPSIILGRGAGIATIVFGISLVPFERFTSFYDWIVFITVAGFWLIVIFYFANKFNKYLEKRNTKNKEKETEHVE